MRLQDALAWLRPEEREALRARRGIVLDPRKRIDEVEQTARALIAETDLRHSRFPSDVRALLSRLAAHNGALLNGASDPGAATLCELGVAYRSRPDAVSHSTPPPAPHAGTGAPKPPATTGKRVAANALVLPSAFLVQLPVTDGDDPRSLRVCLGFVDNEILPSLVATVVGRPLAVTGALALQEVWEVLSAPGEIAARVAQLPSAEARLLDAIERAGSEVTTDELLALDQTPGLYRTASGIAVPKRGAPFMLQRRGFLFQIGVDRFVLPTEVSRVVGAARQAERAGRRAQILAAVRADDHAPRRARYARDPSLAAAAALAMLRAWEVAVRDDAGTPRGAVRRIAERLGEREETAALLVALLRASGLARLALPDVPVPGSLAGIAIGDVGAMLRAAYRRGGAWDETRVDGEVARVGLNERATTAAPTLRTILLDALDELARDRWVPVDVVVKYALDDPRAAGAARIHERARRERPGQFCEAIEPALRAMLTESIPAIGLADLGEDGGAVRLAARDAVAPTRSGPSVSRTSLEVRAGTPLHKLMALADFAEPDHIKPDAGAIVLALGAPAVARARARGLDAAAVLARFHAIDVRNPLPPAVADLVAGLGAQRSAGVLPVGAAIVIDDDALRAEVAADPAMRRMLLAVDAGRLLLVRADADRAKLNARLARLGVKAEAMEPEPAAPDPASEPPPPPARDTTGRIELRKRRTTVAPPASDADRKSKASNG